MCIRDSGVGHHKHGWGHIRRHDVIAHGHTARDLDVYQLIACLLYTSDAADERSSVDLGGRRIIKKKNLDIILGITVQHQ